MVDKGRDLWHDALSPEQNQSSLCNDAGWDNQPIVLILSAPRCPGQYPTVPSASSS